MATKCGWASIDENGKAKGGKGGDQTGKEVKTGNWYNFNQTIVYRFKDRAKAKKYAQFIKNACANNNIGYDQWQRESLYTQLKKVNMDVTKVKTPCECDCSTLVSAGLIAVGINVPYNMRTATLAQYLPKTGEFTELKDSKYLTSGDYLMTGDIINRPAHHVITALEDGCKANVSRETLTAKEEVVADLQSALNRDYNTSLAVDGKYGPKTQACLKSHNIKKGTNGKYSVKWLQKTLNKLGITDEDGNKLSVDGDFATKTLSAVKKLQKKLKITQDGEVGTGTVSAMLKLF